jgi:hypothetical protein
VTMRFATLLGAAAAVLLMQASFPAQAGLIASPPNTVSVSFFLGAHTAADEEIEGVAVPIGPGGANFGPGVSAESDIHVGDTQITITSVAASGSPFCSTPLPCSDSFTGFEFQFSSGVDITGVSVDPASAPDFLPNTTSPHMGLQLLSSTDILVDVTGDAPNMNDKLILDVTTGPVAVPAPEIGRGLPAAVAIVLVAAWSFRRRSNRPGGPRAAS